MTSENFKDISIVIPAYNEEEILMDEIRRLISELEKDIPGTSYEIVLSENGSTDSTPDIARELSEEFPVVRVISSQEANYGKALKKGIVESRGDIVVVFNADFWDVSALEKARRLLTSGTDVVVCSKNLPGSHDKRPLFRRILTKIFNNIVLRVVFGYPGTDTHGIKMFRREKILPIVSACQTDRDLFDTEIILRSYKAGLRIQEIPITCEEKRASNYGIVRHMPRIAKDIWRLRRSLRSL